MDYEGNKYGRWTALCFSHWVQFASGSRRPMWNCECECGTKKSVSIRAIATGKSVSCGCYHREVVKTPKKTLEAYLAEKSVRPPEGCWTWIGTLQPNGYGRMGF